MIVRITLFLFAFFVPFFLFGQSSITPLQIPARKPDAETGSAFMHRMMSLPLEEREEEIYKALAAGNMPDYLRKSVQLKGSFKDSLELSHELIYEVIPDYLAVGSNEDYCRIPMNPYTAQRLANLFGGSLITAKLSDHIYENAVVKLAPFFYKPVGRENESIEKFIIHNEQIDKQKTAAKGENGQLIAGIKKDVILSKRLADLPNKVVIYGWHQLDGIPIQPVYSGHVDWYVDYSHGIRLMNKNVILDGQVVSVSEILSDPILFKVLSNEDSPMLQTLYHKPMK
jgi:hypothetical protein